MTKSMISISANSEACASPFGKWVPDTKALKSVDSWNWLSAQSPQEPCKFNPEGPSKISAQAWLDGDAESTNFEPGSAKSEPESADFEPENTNFDPENTNVELSSHLCADAPDFSPSILPQPPDFGLPPAPHRQLGHREYHGHLASHRDLAPPMQIAPPMHFGHHRQEFGMPHPFPMMPHFSPAVPAAAPEKEVIRERYARPTPPPSRGDERPDLDRRGEGANKLPLETNFHNESSTYSVQWRIEAKRMEKRDAHMLSPIFDLAFDATTKFSRVPFRIVLFPNNTPGGVQQMKGHRNFRQSQGQGCIQLKCEAEPTKVPSRKILLRFCVGAEDSPDRQLPREGAAHDFSASAAHNFGARRDAPEDGGDWDFKAAVEPDTDSFLVTLEVMSEEAAALVDGYQYQ